MASERTLVELCCGTASVSLWALAGLGPLCGYAGSKRRWAGLLVDAMDIASPDHVVLVDAGPWGDVWSWLRHAEVRTEVAALLEGWDGQERVNLSHTLLDQAPSDQPAQRLAQYLWLQTQTPSSNPLWWSDAGWRIANGSGGECRLIRFDDRPGSRMQRTGVLARRLRGASIPWDRITVHHGDARDVRPIPGSTLYMDPPYEGTKRYAALLPRPDVLVVASAWHAAGARVAVSEREALPLLGWHSRPLPGATRPEWVTSSWPLQWPGAKAPQLELFGGRAA